MSQENILEVVQRKIAAVRGVEAAVVSAEANLKNDLGVTSMEYIVILTDVATSLGIDLMAFTEQEIIGAHTVGDLGRVIASKTLNKENV